MEIITQEGGEILSRWGHVLAGITWIGLLYYFNFVQVPSFAAFEAAPRTEVIQKLVPRALWWFRWGAMLTLATGLSILAFQEGYSVDYLFRSPAGISISTGVLLAVTMFLNVWLIIWPKQKVVIASAVSTAGGGEPDPRAAGFGRQALLASRTNTFFSIPMLFFMVSTSHFANVSFPDAGSSDNRLVYWVIVIVSWAVLQLNGMGVFGTAPGGPRAYLDQHRNTIVAGFVYAAVLYVLWEILLT